MPTQLNWRPGGSAVGLATGSTLVASRALRGRRLLAAACRRVERFTPKSEDPEWTK